MNKRIITLIVAMIVIVLLDISFGQGCSQCKSISEQSAEAGEASFATNINKGILFLLAIPYVILAIALRKHIVKLVKNLFGSAS